MAVKLNLLPTGAGIVGPLAKVFKITRMLGVISMACFLIFALGISAFFILSTITLGNVKTDIDSLKSEINALESTEQQAFLLKDRVGKIKAVQQTASASKNIEAVDSLVGSFPPSAALEELTLDPQKIDLSVQITSTAETSSFLSMLSTSKSFALVVMTNFGYSPAKGYSLTLRLSTN